MEVRRNDSKGQQVKRTALRRTTPLRKANARRRARLRAEQFGPEAERVRAMPCCACGHAAPSDPHHMKSRGAGGKAKDLVALCHSCHVAVHAQGAITFWRNVARDRATA